MDKEALIDLFSDHIRAVMECNSRSELKAQIDFIVHTLSDYSTRELVEAIPLYDRPDVQIAKIELAKLLTIELSLIKISG